MSKPKRIQEFIEGLLLLEPYDRLGFGLQAEHDELFCNVDTEPPVEVQERLKTLGWRVVEDDPCQWRKFT